MHRVSFGTKNEQTEDRLRQSDQSYDQHVKPVAILKPKLVFWLVIVRYLIVQINMTFVGGAIGGAAIFLHQIYLGTVNLTWEPFVYSGLFFFFSIPILAIVIHKRTYDLTRYVFFEDHLEYYEGFWNVERKVIQYKKITEIELKKSMIQRIYHIGSIHALVPSLGSRNSGIVIADIKKPEKAYDFLLKAVQGISNE